MNTIKIFLAESGRIADLRKDFPLYQKQFQNKLLNIFVPTSILAPQFNIQHYIGQISGAVAPTSEELDAFVLANTYPQRESARGDIIEFFNNTDNEFFLYEYNGEEWADTQVDGFGSFSSIAGTSVKIGMTALRRNGTIYESKSYFMRYLKTLVYQGVEYALYERKLPKEFTLYAGQGQNAPTLIANVVNVDTESNQILSLITSQTCQLDVMTSTILDNDEPIEATDLERLEAQVNENSAELMLKQDKIDDGLLTTEKSVVGAINEVKGTADTNSTNIYTNTQDIVDIKAEQITQNEDISANTANIQVNTENITNLQNRVSTLEEQSNVEETYIGQMTGSSLPTTSQLNQFVLNNAQREPKGGDVIIFILTIPNATDKVYKYTYSIISHSWNSYELPATEPASNTSKGIIQGSYNSGTVNKTQVNVINGEIEDIYIVDNTSTKRRLAEYLNTDNSTLATTTQKSLQNEQNISTNAGKISTLETSVGNILNGTTSVPKATNATNDGLGNNISTTYMTINAGVTKTQMKDYALPRAFNDVSFFTDTGYSSNVPSEASPIHTLTTTAVGDFEVFSAEKTLGDVTFQLADKNSYTDTIFASASADCSVQFRLTTQIYVNNAWVTANVELSDEISMLANQIKKLVFASSMNALNGVYTLASGSKIKQSFEVVTQTSSSITFSIYSNDTYPSTFYLNTTSQVITLTQGKLGQLPVFDIIGTGDATKITFELPTDVQIDNNVESLFVLHYTGTTTDNTQVEFSLDSQAIQLLTPANIGTNNPATVETIKSKFCSSANKWVFTGVFSISGAEIKVIADIDNVNVPESNPNLLINGDFSVNQRGQSTYSTNSAYTVDRWALVYGSLAVNTNGSVSHTATNTWQGIRQYVEHPERLVGKTITFSAYGETTGLKALTVSYKQTSASAAVRLGDIATTGNGIISITVDIPNSLTKESLLYFILYTPSANQTVTWYWAKAEIGSIATPFNPRPYGEELALCQRYYQVLRVDSTCYCANTAHLYPNIPIPVTFRTTPTIYSTITKASVRGDGQIQTSTNNYVSAGSTSDNILLVDLPTSDLSLTTGNLYVVTNSSLSADAEIY